MQRLLTGYSVNFNKLHKRKGHLFQNRYKSIVVDEEPYFLELLRYIHLNPVRAGILRTLGQLNRFTFTGHAVLVGKRKFAVQNIDDVLIRFSPDRTRAIAAYEEFVTAGFGQGTREDLRGGGLVRSSGGVSSLLGKAFEEREAADDRILGLGDFVESVLNRGAVRRISPETVLDEILREVAKSSGVGREQIVGPSKDRSVSKARREFYLRAQEGAGATAAQLARMTGRAHVSVARALEIARQERGDKQLGWKATKATYVPSVPERGDKQLGWKATKATYVPSVPIDKEKYDPICYKDEYSYLTLDRKIEKILKKPELAKLLIKQEQIDSIQKTLLKDIKIKRLEYCRALHAEENALLQSSKIGGVGVNGGIIFTTSFPCELCAKKIYQSGIVEVIYTEPYPDSISQMVILKDGVKRIKLTQFEGVKSHSYFRLYKANMDRKERIEICRRENKDNIQEPSLF
jgi:putative transposase